jgi:hypothetical protein
MLLGTSIVLVPSALGKLRLCPLTPGGDICGMSHHFCLTRASSSWSTTALAVGYSDIIEGRLSFLGLLKLDVKGLASYITISNHSALVFPRIVGVNCETKRDGAFLTLICPI